MIKEESYLLLRDTGHQAAFPHLTSIDKAHSPQLRRAVEPVAMDPIKSSKPSRRTSRLTRRKRPMSHTFTSAKRLAIQGYSNGSLLIGASVTQHPSHLGVTVPPQFAPRPGAERFPDNIR